MKKMNKKGFTIVELVIVIAVIAILAGVMIPTFSGIVNKANQSKSLQEVRNAYTVYVSDTLHANSTPAPKISVQFGTGNDAYYITIDDGKAEVTTTTPANDYAPYVICENAANDKTLATSHNFADNTTPCSKCGAAQ